MCFVFRVERSTDQVIKPVNVEALSKWVGKIPADVVRDMAVIAPMLTRLGYDPHANPPNYGQPDPKVLDNTRRVGGSRIKERFDLFELLLGASRSFEEGVCSRSGACFIKRSISGDGAPASPSTSRPELRDGRLFLSA